MELVHFKVAIILCLIATASGANYGKSPPSNWKLLFGVAAGVGVGMVLAPVIAPLALYVVGFTGKGVAAGSLAAYCQSWVGSVGAGGAFALIQSAGASGIGYGTTGVFAGIGGFLGYMAVK